MKRNLEELFLYISLIIILVSLIFYGYKYFIKGKKKEVEYEIRKTLKFNSGFIASVVFFILAFLIINLLMKK